VDIQAFQCRAEGVNIEGLEAAFGESGAMGERQLDLFSETGRPPPRQAWPSVEPSVPIAADLDDGALIAAIPDASLATVATLTTEAGRRRLVAAISALEQLCRRFAGFGLERKVPEQVAALEALAQIGDQAAAQAVARLIARSIVQGPTRKVAVGIAAQLRSPLPAGTLQALLQDADPDVRADACRCADAWPAAMPILHELTDDGESKVRGAAWCALGRRGWHGARPALLHLLREAPSAEIIDAICEVADEDCIIVLGRIVRTRPALADAAREALAMIDHPRARQVFAALPS
jgi:HEAT repeat protein